MKEPGLETSESEFCFPYVVIRWMACAYGRGSVAKSTTPNGRTAEGYSIHESHWSAPTTLTPMGETILIEMVLADVIRMKHRMCVVFTQECSVYIELDGSKKYTSPPPSGGLRIDKQPIHDPAE